MAELLSDGGEDARANAVRTALEGSDASVEEFLCSNTLWGGPGSIADQPFMKDKARRKRLEELLIEVGRLQIAEDRVNVRTRMWVQAFENWRRAGLP